MKYKKLTPEQVKAEINRRNKLFKGKSNREKRVLIAKDIIEQIKLGQLKPEIGDFINFDNSFFDSFYEGKKGDCLREAIISDTEKCNVCALGAVFLSATLFNNNVNRNNFLREINPEYKIRMGIEFANKLDKIFTKRQLKSIEIAFEMNNGYFNHLEIDGGENFVRFGEKYKNPKSRLIAIMENIIQNDGKFNPNS